MMKYALIVSLLFCTMSGEAMAGKLVLKGSRGATTVNSGCNCNGVVNKGTINGGGSTGLTVSGTPSKTIVNKGTITGTTGLLVTGSSSKIVNTGVIQGSSTGIMQVP
jgi:hypothetical protein